MSHLADCYRYTNGTVLCMDDEGVPVAECQGKYVELCQKIKKHADEGTRFYWARWGGLQIPVSKEHW